MHGFKPVTERDETNLNVYGLFNICIKSYRLKLKIV